MRTIFHGAAREPLSTAGGPMTNEKTTSGLPENAGTHRPIDQTPSGRPSDPMHWFGTLVLGVYFFSLAAMTFYLLVATWPVFDSNADAANSPAKYGSFSVFGSNPITVPSDLRLFFTVVVSGALGSLIHCITSFADYVGNQNLSRSWTWWLVLRTPTGVALALLFYLVLRGGLIVPSLPNGSTADTAHFLNPYGIAAISAMAGMFSKQATDKLREIFDTLFQTRDPVSRADPLGGAAPVVLRCEPTKLGIGETPVLNVFGHDFARDCKAFVNGNPRAAQWLSDTRLALTLLPEDTSAEGQLRLQIQNPGAGGSYSPEFSIPIEKRSA